MTVGRNDPCPCGSGKKFKKCCAGKEAAKTVDPTAALRMKSGFADEYLQRAQEIIGERSPTEVAYDDAIVRYLRGGMDIRQALAAANRDHPAEALQVRSEDWEDLASRYEYLAEHKAILERLGIRE